MSDVTTVTGDTLDAFHAERLNLAKPAEAVNSPIGDAGSDNLRESAVPAADDAVSGDSGLQQGAEEGAEKDSKDKPNKLQSRFSELTQQREQAKAEAQRERERAEKVERDFADFKAKLAPPATNDEKREPVPADFTDAFEYAKALSKYQVEQALAARDKADADRSQRAERDKVVNAWNERLAAAKAELPDFQEMIESAADVQISDQVRDAILESEVGPKIMYHLAEHPDVAERLRGMTVISALREIGKIEARLETKPAEQPKPAAKLVPVRKPPVETITPIKASNTIDVPLTADGEFTGSFDQYKAARAAGKIK